MKLSIRMSLVIGAISIALSSVAAIASYYIQLEQAQLRSELLVNQLAKNAAKTSAIAAYVNDTELANEIVLGLVANDLIASAIIDIDVDSRKVFAGVIQASSTVNAQGVWVKLINPFTDGDVIGRLTVYPQARFIEQQASSASMQNTLFLVSLSILTAIALGLYVRMKLTGPLKVLSNEVSKVNTSKPDTMKEIDFGYTKKDEIGALKDKTNALISALQQRFMSELELKKTTE
jgi:HAMP domain-containing protein